MESDKAQDGRLTHHPDGRDPDAIERPVFAAVIRPHCSLGRTGFQIVMAACCLVSLVTSLVFLRQGFWPIAGFFGLDMVALWFALSVSMRRGRSFEEVVVSQIEILLARVSHRGERSEWRFNPLWSRIQKVEDDEYGLQSLAIVSRGRRVLVARDASPPERETIAEGLSRALAEVKKGF
ncbi:DUF2244 domain-containing protein [Methylobacterium nodulans]|uniref:DUF2244 domain-containing protein n=1 Tax=Methylobacterium nodulans (strain LMG 21967 / CNCM I-2342 / ORS 2060) TaxID=460265 RepID=B8IFR1_METNO|nr:DUF2244 domain-containing protein [Methylobacterium nodulans]ACL59621.1 conserved hypothetical protein [Methylobacterium nodulans ORS 2060]